MMVRPGSQRVTWSHQLTKLRLTNHSGVKLKFESAVVGNAGDGKWRKQNVAGAKRITR